MTSASMRLRVLLPARVLVDDAARRIVARAVDGSFCLLPRHADFVTALVPGILVFTTVDERERFVACDEAILVKAGNDVLISAQNGMAGDDLATLQRVVHDRRRELDEETQRAHSALARLEASTIRRFVEMERQGRV